MGYSEALELGESMIDAGQMTYETEQRHEIEFIGDKAVAVPANMVSKPPDDQQVDIIIIP